MPLHMTTLADDVENGVIKTHLHPLTLSYTLKVLDNFYRFVGDDIVTSDRTETPAAHIERTRNTATNLIGKCAPGNPDAIATMQSLILSHESDEVFTEDVRARSEMNPELQARLQAVDPVKIKMNIAVFNYQLGLTATKEESPSLYFETIEEIRGSILPKDYKTRSMNAEELLAFYTGAQRNIDSRCQSMKLENGFYDSRTKTPYMMNEIVRQYSNIEYGRTFLGNVGKILEKADGTAYKTDISRQRAEENRPPTNWHEPGYEHLRSSMLRYELLLGGLYQMAQGADKDVPDPRHRLNIALAVADIVYETSLNRVRQTKDYVTTAETEGEPTCSAPQGKHDDFIACKGLAADAGDAEKASVDAGTHPRIKLRTQLIGRYEEAREALQQGILSVPEKGHTLATSPAVQKIETPYYKPKTIHVL